MDDKTTVLHDYYKAKLQLEILTLELKEKQEAVLEYLAQQPDGKAAIDHAKFTIIKTPVYEFSEYVQHTEETRKEADKILKDQKALEIKNGKAKIISETTTVRMTKI